MVVFPIITLCVHDVLPLAHSVCPRDKRPHDRKRRMVVPATAPAIKILVVCLSPSIYLSTHTQTHTTRRGSSLLLLLLLYSIEFSANGQTRIPWDTFFFVLFFPLALQIKRAEAVLLLLPTGFSLIFFSTFFPTSSQQRHLPLLSHDNNNDIPSTSS